MTVPYPSKESWLVLAVLLHEGPLVLLDGTKSAL
jgi:hypothetical protein